MEHYIDGDSIDIEYLPDTSDIEYSEGINADYEIQEPIYRAAEEMEARRDLLNSEEGAKWRALSETADSAVALPEKVFTKAADSVISGTGKVLKVGAGLAAGAIDSPLQTADAIARASNNVLDTKLEADYAEKYGVGRRALDAMGITDDAFGAYYVGGMVPSIVGGSIAGARMTGWLASKLPGRLLESAKYGRFFRALRSPTTIAESGSQGIAQAYGGAIAREATENLAGSAITSPLWLFQKDPEDIKYKFSAKTLLSSVATDIAFGGAIGYARASRMLRADRIAQFAKNNESIKNAIDDLTFSVGNAVAAPSKKVANTVSSYLMWKSLENNAIDGTDAIATARSITKRNAEKYMGVGEMSENAFKSFVEYSFNDASNGITTVYKAKKGQTPDVWFSAEKGFNTEGLGVGFKRTLHTESTQDFLIKKTAVDKAAINKSASKSFITDMEIAPEFKGEVSDEAMDILANVHETDPQKTGMRAFLQPYARAVQTDALRQSAVKMGERSNRIRMAAKGEVAERLKLTRELLADKSPEAQREINNFFELYSSARNLGWDIDTDGLRIVDGQIKLKLAETSYNMETAQRLGLDDIPEYMPSARNPHVDAFIENGTRAGEVFKEISEVEDQITNALRHAAMASGDSPTLKSFYTRMSHMEGDEIWRLYDADNPVKHEREYYSFRTKEDAEKMKKILEMDGTTTYKMDKGADGLLAIGRDPNTVERLYETRGHARGHFQGKLIDTGTNALLEVYSSIISGVDDAAKQNIRAYNGKVFDAIELLGKTDVYEELSQVMLGNAPKLPINYEIDRATRKVASILTKMFTTQVDVNPNDLFRALELPKDTNVRRAVSTVTRGLGIMYYSAMNISGSVLNGLSLLQALPTTMAWYNKTPLETAAQYAIRTGIKGTNRGVGFFDGASLGTGFMKKLSTDKAFRDNLILEAKVNGIAVSELSVLQQALDPMSTMLDSKLVALSSKSITWSEEYSRVVAYGIGKEYAEQILKLKDKRAQAFANNFVLTSFGGYSPLYRAGVTNSILGQHMSMFTTYAQNNLYRNLDMIVDKNYRGYVAANIINWTLFGFDTEHLLNFRLSGYDLDDDIQQRALYDMGLAGVMNIGIGERMDARSTQFTAGLTKPAIYGFLTGMYDLGSAVISDIALSGEVNGTALAEAVASRSPVLAFRRLAQAGLGYSTTLSGNIKTDARNDLLDRAMLFAGFAKADDVITANKIEYKRLKDGERASAKQKFRRLVLPRIRAGDSPESIMEKGIEIFGYDVNALEAVMLSIYESANKSNDDRLRDSIINGNMDMLDVFLIQSLANK